MSRARENVHEWSTRDVRGRAGADGRRVRRHHRGSRERIERRGRLDWRRGTGFRWRERGRGERRRGRSCLRGEWRAVECRRRDERHRSSSLSFVSSFAACGRNPLPRAQPVLLSNRRVSLDQRKLRSRGRSMVGQERGSGALQGHLWLSYHDARDRRSLLLSGHELRLPWVRRGRGASRALRRRLLGGRDVYLRFHGVTSRRGRRPRGGRRY